MIATKDITVCFLTTASLLLPLFSFAFLFLAKEKFSEHTRGILATTSIFISFCCALSAFFYLGLHSEFHYNYHWFSYTSGNLMHDFSFSVLLNGMTLLMLNVVLFISLLVHLYSMEYMHHKKNHAVYYPYLGLFTASMVLLVMSNNLLITFMAWELVGFSSYLLVGFWFDREAAAKAASKAFLMNRVADVFFLAALFLVFVHLGSFDLSQIQLNHTSITSSIQFWIGLLFFIGCMAKTAQFPLNSWLPDAMEGPTPVSALLHAATMVAAGVFLLVKLDYLLTEDVRLVMAIVGAITAFFGAIPALTSFDAKKILAFSTVSQLGYMIATIGCSAPGAAYFHLITHAFFKAGLFLSVGVVIHALHEVQVKSAKEYHFLEFNTMDLRMMGGLGKHLPLAMIAYVVTAASLIGLPFFSGFLSKESMLNAMFGMAFRYEGLFWVVPILGIITVLMTAYYVTRQGMLIFYGESRLTFIKAYSVEIWSKIDVRPVVFMIPLVLLTFASLFIGFSLDPFSAHGSWVNHLSGIAHVELESYGFVVLISLVCVLTGILGAYVIFRKQDMSIAVPFLAKVSTHFYYLDQVVAAVVISPLLRLSHWLSRFDKHGLDGAVHMVVYITVFKAHIIAWFDKTFVDGVISSAVYLTGRVGKVFRVFQKGNVQNYLFWVLVILLSMALWMVIQWYV